MRAASPSDAVTLPDYGGGGIANLMSSIAAAFGMPHAACPPLREALPALARRSHLLLIVVDGLGYRYLMQGAPAGTLARHAQRSLTSVFPSTTASAITTFLTGATPAEHGLIGWHVYLEEIDAIAAVLPFQLRGSDEPLERLGLRAADLSGRSAFADRIPAAVHAIAPRKIVDSAFNSAHCGRAQRHGYGTLAEFFQAIERCLRSDGERNYVYAYWPELDSIAHEHGIGSRQAAESLRRFDDGFARLLACLQGRDVSVLATGDHGFIDAPAEGLLLVERHPRFEAMLARPLWGERRVAYCHVKPERRVEFEDYVRNELSAAATLYPSRELIEQGWFGPGVAHPRLASRVGDYTLVMRGDATIKDWLPGEKRYRHIGVHGGVSEDEMRVPLVVVEP
jgi:hypothetical protein